MGSPNNVTTPRGQKIGELIPSEGVATNDVDALLSRLLSAAADRGYLARELGRVGTNPILVLHPRAIRDDRPHILVAAGVHGDEPGGPFAVLRALRTLSNELIAHVQISFLPVVNPTGLRKGTRHNAEGRDPNRGFAHQESPFLTTTLEVQVILNNLEQLLALARDGFVSLHEDWEESRFYMYSFEPRQEPGPFSTCLREIGARHFPLVPDGPIEDVTVVSGVAFRACDGSLEDRLFHEGVPATACTETPGQAPIEQRITCAVDIVRAMAEFVRSQI